MLEEQVSATWLGGGVQNAVMAASEFLMSQGKLDQVLDSYADSATPKFAADGSGRRVLIAIRRRFHELPASARGARGSAPGARTAAGRAGSGAARCVSGGTAGDGQPATAGRP